MSGHSDPGGTLGVPLVRVRLWRADSTVTCDIETKHALASLSPLTPPADRRLRMLWFAEKISPQINVAIHDGRSTRSSRIRVRAHPD